MVTIVPAPSQVPTACPNNVLSQCGGAGFVSFLCCTSCRSPFKAAYCLQVRSVCCPVGSCCTYANPFWSDCQPSDVACPTTAPSGLFPCTKYSVKSLSRGFVPFRSAFFETDCRSAHSSTNSQSSDQHY